jgi:outer membrane protein TolC
VLLGLSADSLVELAADDPAAESIPVPEVGILAPDWPELAAMRRRLDASEQQVKIARSARMPKVGAFASVEENKGWRRDGDGQNWTAGISVGMTLFDGSETSSRIREATAALDQTRQQERKVRLALELRLRQARINHDVAMSQLEVCTSQVEQADESARLSRERFAAGSLLSAELIGVETRLADARVQLAVSRAKERVALAELRTALALPILN